jgi:carboxymethylenebutenolidase
MMTKPATGGIGKRMAEVWQQHVYSEFVLKDAKAALTTMTDDPHVLMVPIAVGGKGSDGVYDYYSKYFLTQLPADLMPIPISQVIGTDTLVEEAVYTFTHDQVMDWMIPGVRRTGKRVEVAVVGVIKFVNDRIASEHLYWDHATVLAQLGIIDPDKASVKPAESARTLLAWAGITPSGASA